MRRSHSCISGMACAFINLPDARMAERMLKLDWRELRAVMASWEG